MEQGKARPGFGVTPIVPAYGREYKNKAEVEGAWLASQDFVTPNGQYINRPQFVPGSKVQVRYGKNLEKTTVVTA